MCLFFPLRMLVCVLAGGHPEQVKALQELSLTAAGKTDRAILRCSNKFREFVFKTHYTKTVKHGVSVYSALMLLPLILSFLLSSLHCIPLLILSILSLPLSFHPLLRFLLSFWLNKLVSLMSNDTSRSQSQLPDNKMAVTFCLSTICVCLFQFSLHLPWCKELYHNAVFANIHPDYFVADLSLPFS